MAPRRPRRVLKTTSVSDEDLLHIKLQLSTRLTAIVAQDKQAVLLNSPNPGHFSLLRAYHMADFITLMNGFCGFMSITSSMRYCANPNEKQHLWLALGFMPFGLLFDFFDGMVARMRKKSSMMGQELDSLADLVRSVTHVVTKQ